MAIVTPTPAFALLVAAKTTILAGTSTTILPVFVGGAGTMDQSVGTVTSGKVITVTPPGVAGNTVTYTLTVGTATKTVAITLN